MCLLHAVFSYSFCFCLCVSLCLYLCLSFFLHSGISSLPFLPNLYLLSVSPFLPLNSSFIPSSRPATIFSLLPSPQDSTLQEFFTLCEQLGKGSSSLDFQLQNKLEVRKKKGGREREGKGELNKTG